MIWGLEGRHQWDGGVILNRRVDDAGDLLLPRYKLARIGGLSSLGDSEDVRELPVGREGEVPRRSLRRGKTVTYEGVTQARSLDDLRQAEADLRSAFYDQRAEKLMVVTPHPDYASGSRFYRARALAAEINDEQGAPVNVSLGYERSFIVSVRLSDPRYYDGVEQTESVLVLISDDSETVVCTNGGNVATDPVLTLTSTLGAIQWASVRAADYAFVHPSLGVTIVGNQPMNWDGTKWVGTVPTNSQTYSMNGSPVLNDGDRVLVYNFDGAADERMGIFTVEIIAAGASPPELHRAVDADATADFVEGKRVQATSGLNIGRWFRQATSGAVTPNVTDLLFDFLTSDSGEIPGVSIINETVGAKLVLPTLDLAAGDEVIIDFRTRTISLNGLDAPGSLNYPLSDWWDSGVAGLAPGANTIRVQAADPTVTPTDFDVTCEIAWYDAFA